MSDDGWIVVPNWDKFQHYSDRSPTWIKVYTELNSREDFLNLSLHERGVLLTIWLEYARSRGVLPVRRAVRTRDNRYANAMHALDSLLSAGFIEVCASKPLALVRKEKSRKARTREGKNKTEPRAAAAAYQPFPNGHPDRDVEAGLTAIHDFLINDDDRPPS